MAGDSRDFSIRKTLDQRVRAYFQSHDAGRIDEMKRWYADDVIQIFSVQVLGKIWKGKEEVIASHEKALADRKRRGWTIVTVPTWVIVDRGRITCRIERFYSEQTCKGIIKYTFLAVFDLDSTGHLTGESRDRNLRPFIEGQAKKLIDDLFWGEKDLASEWFDASISLVINLEQNPGVVFLGKDEAMGYFKNHDDKKDMEQKWYDWNIVLVTADRGRVTSYAEKLSVEFNENGAVSPIDKEVILITMDLNDSNKIQRMEYRVLRRDKIANHMPWEEAVAKLITKSVVIDYNI
ncbi:hypothetical protein GCG54_00003945 [Colletotrichum gloeosporioides]|uniref:Uncharacterized protein n=1 Tax=Colletotrichum gloeosporioides TaxID=474922 RepID=A0A8H4C6E9_COLGL|nr:uncharacterized protein GCG54_00003945 [Colletotrichum gloeosporioides]KAF3798042.1 hypothetical protein GCG54_00003945 [Colletotrichum gloeosporioides]